MKKPLKSKKPKVIKKNRSDYFVTDNMSMKFIDSGCTLLNCVTGGGWPLGRIVNIVGDKSSGKSLLCIEACVNFLKQFPKGHIWYHEAEACFDEEYARALGMPVDDVIFGDTEYLEKKGEYKEGFEPDTIEGVYNRLVAKIENGDGEPGLFILDSLDAISDETEKEADILDKSYNVKKQKQLSVILRKLVKPIEKSNICFVVISQVRANIGVRFGPKTKRSGGKALDHFACIILWLTELRELTKVSSKIKKTIGLQIKAKCKKNKVALAYRECEFPLIFAYGVDSITANLDWLKKCSFLSKLRLAETNISKIANTVKQQVSVGDFVLKDKIDTLVIECWREQEKEFLPEYSKY